MSEQDPQNTKSTTRRGFLKTSALAATAAAPYYAPASVFGAAAPSNRITMACIGVGNQGFPVMQRFLQHDDCQILAVCDVNRGSHGYKEKKHFYGREPAKQTVEKHYSKSRPSGSYKGCEAYHDFRDVLARDDVDAVVIVSPDHWHSIMTIRAAEAGKDIYCEKPLGLTIGDQQAMVKAVRQNNRILQTGSHERSNPNVRRACELVRSGAIGKVQRVIAHVGRHNKIGPGPGWQPSPIPDGFDYDMWLGPAPQVPYHKDRCLYNFRFNYDYAGGEITNFGAHSLDMAQGGLGMDDSGPIKIEHVFADYLPKGSLLTRRPTPIFAPRMQVVLCWNAAQPNRRSVASLKAPRELFASTTRAKTFPPSLQISNFRRPTTRIPKCMPATTTTNAIFLIV